MKIQGMDEEILRLREALKGPGFKKAIAEVVTNNFQYSLQ